MPDAPKAGLRLLRLVLETVLSNLLLGISETTSWASSASTQMAGSFHSARLTTVQERITRRNMGDGRPAIGAGERGVNFGYREGQSCRWRCSPTRPIGVYTHLRWIVPVMESFVWPRGRGTIRISK